MKTIDVTVTKIQLPQRFDAGRKLIVPAQTMYRAVSGRFVSVRDDRASAISDVVKIVRHENKKTNLSLSA